MDLYQVNDYRHYLKYLIYDRDKRWGLVKEVAKAVQCHPTYISQVCGFKAHFSSEQTYLAADFFQLPPIETDFFLISSI